MYPRVSGWVYISLRKGGVLSLWTQVGSQEKSQDILIYFKYIQNSSTDRKYSVSVLGRSAASEP